MWLDSIFDVLYIDDSLKFNKLKLRLDSVLGDVKHEDCWQLCQRMVGFTVEFLGREVILI